MYFNREIWNTVYLGLCFTALFSADFTVVNMQKTLAYSIRMENPSYNIDGYLSLGLVYSVYGIFLWLAPSVIALTGPKLGLILGSTGYIFLVFSLTAEIVWVTYLGMVIGGIGGSLLWVAEGNYMVISSQKNNISRNVGIFWALYSSSLIFGNLFAVLELKGKERIEYGTRHSLLYSLGSVAVIATFMFFLLESPKENKYNEQDTICDIDQGPFFALKKTWNIFCKKNILLLLGTFIYAGFQQSFGQGIYSPCLGFTSKFGSYSKQLIPLSGMVYGLGDLLGGLSQIKMASSGRQIKYWAPLVFTFGFLLQTIAYILIFLNIPNKAIFGETSDSSILEPRISLALLSSFFIGVGDSCINTEIYPLIASLEPDNSAQTCALYKFAKSMAMALCFFVSPFLGLHIQLLIIFLFGIISTSAFVLVYRRTRFLTQKPN